MNKLIVMKILNSLSNVKQEIGCLVYAFRAPCVIKDVVESLFNEEDLTAPILKPVSLNNIRMRHREGVR
jgi:hypothetical protein